MTTAIERIRSGFQVVGIENARNAAKTPAFLIIAKNATSGQIGGDESGFSTSVRLAIENQYSAEQPSEPTPCKQVGGYFLCRNPYPTSPHDKWLLAEKKGLAAVAMFCAATPALCRLWLHTQANKLTLG